MMKKSPIIFICSLFIFGCNDQTSKVALGTLERDRIAQTATVSEVITALPIKPGTLVNIGDVLVKLDNTFQLSQVAKAKAGVAQAEANLEKLRSGARPEELAVATANVNGARATLVESEANYKRTLDLAKSKLTSQASLNSAVATRDKSGSSLDAAKEALKQLTNGTRIEDLKIGEANLEAAEAILASENKKLSDLTIKATRSGILDNLPWNLGERVTVGSPLAIILAGNAPYARVYIPETYRVNVHLNDEFSIHVDGLEQTIIGKVRWISSEPAFSPYFALNQEERARLMYLAEIQLPDENSELPNGLPVQVQLP